MAEVAEARTTSLTVEAGKGGMGRIKGAEAESDVLTSLLWAQRGAESGRSSWLC